MNFSEILARKRKSLGLSQDELAEKIEVSRQAISKWENGETMPEAAKLIMLRHLRPNAAAEFVQGLSS